MTLQSLPHWFPVRGLCALVLIGSTAGRARADEGAPPALESPTPRECTGRFVAGPSVGIPVGLGTAAFGAVLIYAASNPLGDAFGGDASSNNSPGGIAGGSILVGAGLAAFLYSAIKLHKNLAVRRDLCREHDVYQPLAGSPTPRARRVAFDGAGIRF